MFVPPGNATLAQCFTAALAAEFIDVSSASPQPQPGWNATATNNAWSFAAPPAPPATTPTLAQQAQAALAAGIEIASTSTPALNGVYACDPVSWAKVQGTSLYISVNARFPAGMTSLPWADLAGAVHTFTTTAEFQAFATAMGDYVTELQMAVIGQATALPAQPVTIP
ncbi:MAG TPA: hypothetical protein VMF05_10620 [Stellaceae bacterium]|nr:hypothetical protein [Stellaceae bacterium]